MQSFYWTVFIIFVGLALYSYYKQQFGESFTCYPDLFDGDYHHMKTNYINPNETQTLLARNPLYVNKSIIPLPKDLSNTIYYSAYSESGELTGYLKMAVTEQFMASLIDVGFYEQELFGFTGWYGYHIYELVALDNQTALKLAKYAIHRLKEDGNRYYLSILCLDESLATILMKEYKFVLTLKEQSKRFYKDTLYTLVYYK